jgi:hypothetical protein
MSIKLGKAFFLQGICQVRLDVLGIIFVLPFLRWDVLDGSDGTSFFPKTDESVNGFP